MKIQIKKTETKELNVDTPSFYREYNDYYAILDENNILKAYKADDYCRVSNCSPSIMMNGDWSFIKDENIITEQEFMDAFNQAHNFLSLKAELKVSEITTENVYDWEAQNNLKQATNY